MSIHYQLLRMEVKPFGNRIKCPL